MSGCATTIVDVSTTTAPPVSSVAAPAPRGSDVELMDAIGMSMGRIAEALGERDLTTAQQALDDVRAAWLVLQPRLLARDAQLEDDARRLVDLATTAVTRNRPADADKAMRFLSLLRDSLND